MTLYFDHAATTATDPQLVRRMAEILAIPSNASSIHQNGQAARALLESYREELASLLGLGPESVLFTSGATEANNLAIRGFLAGRRGLSRLMLALSSPLEHSSVRTTLERLSEEGLVQLSSMPISGSGQAVVPHDWEGPLDLLCLMAVQNETGVLQQLAEAKELRDAQGAFWLCDVTQAFGLWQSPLGEIGADLYSLSSHKIHGPPGIGALAGPGLSQLRPLITGGPQEQELRAGTQPLALIAGFVEATRLGAQQRDARRSHLQRLKKLLLNALTQAAVPFRINGEGAPIHPGFINIAINGFSGPDLVIALDARGFAVSSGSACATGVMETSPALASMYPDDEQRAAGALRITPGKDTTEAGTLALAEALVEITKKAADNADRRR